jgi:hypothetical protein
MHSLEKWLPTMLTGMLLFLGACQDMKEYRGTWTGKVEQSRLVRRGIDICSRLELEIRQIGASTLDATLTLRRDPDAVVCSSDLADEGAVMSLPSASVTLAPVPEILNDALANLEIEGEPLFTHMSWIRLADIPFMVFLTVYRNDRLEVRLTGPDAYAFFKLSRAGD